MTREEALAYLRESCAEGSAPIDPARVCLAARTLSWLSARDRVVSIERELRTLRVDLSNARRQLRRAERELDAAISRRALR